MISCICGGERMKEKIITVNGVYKNYNLDGSTLQIEALRNISLSITSGEFIV